MENLDTQAPGQSRMENLDTQAPWQSRMENLDTQAPLGTKQNRRATQNPPRTKGEPGVAKGKQFLLPLIHPSCYSSSHLRYGYFVTVI